jgi:hypothetical protein
LRSIAAADAPPQANDNFLGKKRATVCGDHGERGN